MGASQSSYNDSVVDADSATVKDGRHIRPYALAPNSNFIQLSSSYHTLYDGMISLVKDNRYADLLLICGDDRYPVHRAIVCPRSKLLEEECALREDERDYSSPAKPTKIWIDRSECEPYILAAVLNFLYTLDYNARGTQALTFGLPEEVAAEDDDQCTLQGREEGNAEEELSMKNGSDIEPLTFLSATEFTPSLSASQSSLPPEGCGDDLTNHQNELVFHVQMFAAGHWFGITSLCDIAREKLCRRLHSGQWKEEMIGCIREVYRHGNGGKFAGLREVVVKSAQSRFRSLKTSEGWHDLVIEFPEFAAEMLKRL